VSNSADGTVQPQTTLLSNFADASVKSEATYSGKPKKLKRIPSNIIPYVQIEGEAVKDANDKQMIVHYAYAKLELIDFYIEALADKKYIVPHSLDYLKGLQRDLTTAIKTIMDRPLAKSSEWNVKVDYPDDWKG